METENVLVVDDDPDFLEMLERELKEVKGLNIKAVGTARDAVESLIPHRFNLVVSDWAIASDAGPEVLYRADALLKDMNRKTPVLFVSGDDRFALTKTIKPLDNFEPVSFVLKGAGTPSIRLTVQNILNGKRKSKAEEQ